MKQSEMAKLRKLVKEIQRQAHIWKDDNPFSYGRYKAHLWDASHLESLLNELAEGDDG